MQASCTCLLIHNGHASTIDPALCVCFFPSREGHTDPPTAGHNAMAVSVASSFLARLAAPAVSVCVCVCVASFSSHPRQRNSASRAAARQARPAAGRGRGGAPVGHHPTHTTHKSTNNTRRIPASESVNKVSCECARACRGGRPLGVGEEGGLGPGRWSSRLCLLVRE